MPVVVGQIGDRPILMLRDSGANTVLVRRSLVKDEDLTGEAPAVTLVDSTVRFLPEARVLVSTPYYTGQVVAKCVDQPIYDLILGNITGARSVEDPNPEWRLLDVEEHPKEERPATAQTGAVSFSSAVETRAQATARATQRPLSTPVSMCLSVTPGKIAIRQKEDPSLKARFERVGEKVKRKKSPTSFEYQLVNGLLHRECIFSSGRRVQQLVLPRDMRENVLRLGHDAIRAGHQGVQRTVSRITEEFFWPGVQSDVKRFVRSCDVCQRTVPKGRVGPVALGKMPAIDLPFQRVAIDIVGPISPVSAKGNRYVFTLVDVATRYPDAIPLSTIDNIQVAEGLVEMFSHYGFPREVLSDRGSNFTSELMKEVNRLLSVRQLLTTPYHPMCNGLVERFSGTLKNMIKKMCQERPTDWNRYLRALLFAYREVPQTSLGFLPFEMLYGRAVRGPLAILKERWANKEIASDLKTTYTYVFELRDKLEETCRLAHQGLERARECYKGYFDKKATHRNLNPGDKALILLPTDHNKLLMQWKGLYLVTQKKNDMDYELLINNTKKVFHANMLKKYEEFS
ncbi:hypothetical protein V5799_025687 [Amblyomma americanum]|uniref:RNA-directed DNA polymerase n=1 Tax=Amblyomma americanum TaxID=6943 RepID=A0AAQ4E8J5_AMBAM